MIFFYLATPLSCLIKLLELVIEIKNISFVKQNWFKVVIISHKVSYLVFKYHVIFPFFQWGVPVIQCDTFQNGYPHPFILCDIWMNPNNICNTTFTTNSRRSSSRSNSILNSTNIFSIIWNSSSRVLLVALLKALENLNYSLPSLRVYQKTLL